MVHNQIMDPQEHVTGPNLVSLERKRAELIMLMRLIDHGVVKPLKKWKTFLLEEKSPPSSKNEIKLMQ